MDDAFDGILSIKPFYSPGMELNQELEYIHGAMDIMERYPSILPYPSFSILMRVVIYVDVFQLISVTRDFMNELDLGFDFLIHSESLCASQPIHSSPLEICALHLRALGATLTTSICSDTSHILVSSKDTSRQSMMHQILKNSKHKYQGRPELISEKWIQSCFKEKTWIPEEKFRI